MEVININTEYITLGQLLKMKNIISSGGEAKFFLSENVVYVNDVIENRRGRKLYINDIIKINDKIFKIV